MKRLLATTALVAAAALPLQAETSNTADSQAASDYNVTVGDASMSVQNLIGARVYLEEGGDATAASDEQLTDPKENWEDVGEIGDVYVTEDGQIASVVVDAGGFLGIGEREISLSMDNLRLQPDADDENNPFVVYTGARADLEEREAFDQANAENEGYRSVNRSNDDGQTTDLTEAVSNDSANDETSGTQDQANMSGQENSSSMADSSMDINGMTLMGSDLFGQSVYIRGQETADAEIAETAEDASADWERVGEIGDVVISQDGEMRGVVIDAGGFLGMGEKHIRTNMDELKFVRDSNDEGDYFIVFTGNRAKLEERQEANPDAWSDAGETSYMAEGWAERQTERDNATLSNQETATDDTGDTAMAGSDALRDTLTAEDVEGSYVYGPGDENIGDIGELVMTADGKIDKVVIDVGGFLGIGERPVAIAFNDLQFRQEDGGDLWISVPYSQEELENLPEWEG